MSDRHSQYPGRSPTTSYQDLPYSPTRGSHSRPIYNPRGRSPTPASFPLPSTSRGVDYNVPPSPTNGISTLNESASRSRENATTIYYDPTSDQPEPNANRRDSFHSRLSQPQLQETPFHGSYSDNTVDSRSFTRPSPVKESQRHFSPPQYPARTPPAQPQSSFSKSPMRSPWDYGATQHHRNGDASPKKTGPGEPTPSPVKSNRANPMAFSSILSNATMEPVVPEPGPYVAAPTIEPSEKARQSSYRSSHLHEPVPQVKSRSRTRRLSKRSPEHVVDFAPDLQSNGEISEDKAQPQTTNSRGRKSPTSTKEHDLLGTCVDLDDMPLSDVETGDFQQARLSFEAHSRKRTIAIEEAEARKRKRRRTTFAEKLSDQLVHHAEAAERRFRDKYQAAAIAEVQHREVLDEKERKKDMQRKRRREKTIQNETQKRNDAIEKAKKAADTAEREKFIREAQRAERKARYTKLALASGGAATAKELREVTPLAPNFEGGIMASFSLSKPKKPDTETKKKSGRGGARPRKSKEQKQAEKDAAEAAHAALEKNEPIAIAPKEKVKESSKEMSKVKGKEKGKEKTKDKSKEKSKDKAREKEPKAKSKDKSKDKDRATAETKEEKATPAKKDAKPAKAEEVFVPYVSKGYHQIYEQIWRDLARKDIPRVYRLKEASLVTRLSNLRKTAQLASKEARRWQIRTNKSMKDVQARAKRSMREMMSFWKRNEREERDLRRLAEKQELENAKKAEADREANRQKRKLNFLISQTELYSHFIGAKVKTDEVERSTDRPEVAGTPVVRPSAAVMSMDGSLDRPTGKVTDFEKLDFDDEDESKLQDIARANAQNAVQEAQDRARAFNNGGEAPVQPAERFDGDEMNFQNPTSLGEISVEQPKMLDAQLKEYQLKGLNWLVNLYEQGINGILADEMGLGKTVQSISVMAYLAEAHNIWGPFLVIAPASTLHNWQQEISRFVPDLKVLPYWGNAKDRKVLRKFWDRKHITYTRESPFHVLVTSYQLVVQDAAYFQKIRWQYMILDEAQAIKSSSSSRWKSLLGFSCRNRLLLTGTPIQNNMQELWALLHFIMPSLFDSHDEFSEWFSKDIESHAQSNTKLNEDQLKRLHMILKPFMLRRIKKHVQKELGDKIELDVYCDLTYRQRAYYSNLRKRISILDLIEKAAVGDDKDTATLMNLVMQFRKVCNHPDLFERADTSSPLSITHFAETSSFLREGSYVHVDYSARNLITYTVPRLLYRHGGRLNLPGPDNERVGFRHRYFSNLMSVWSRGNIFQGNVTGGDAFAWLRFVDTSVGGAADAFHDSLLDRIIKLRECSRTLSRLHVLDDDEDGTCFTPAQALFRIVDRQDRRALAEATQEGRMRELLNVSATLFRESGLGQLEQCARARASAPPVDVYCSSRGTEMEKEEVFFNLQLRRALHGPDPVSEIRLVDHQVDPAWFPVAKMLPRPISEKARYTDIQVPSMRRFVTDSGKLAKLDLLLTELKEGGHRVLLYFQMTRMIDLMEEYLTYRNYKYLRLDGSTKLEDRRDTVHDFQTRPEIFVFLLSTRAGGLGINLTAADTVIFYDSDWNPTIDSQAMDRAHRLGQTRQVTVYRMITRHTIEERIRKRALQKEEVQRVVISGGSGAGVDFSTRSKESRTKDIAMWLADDDQAAEIERKEAETAAADATKEAHPPGKKTKAVTGKKRKADVSLDEMYHEGEGHFDDGSNKASGAATPIGQKESDAGTLPKISTQPVAKGRSKKAKTAKERLRMADGE